MSKTSLRYKARTPESYAEALALFNNRRDRKILKRGIKLASSVYLRWQPLTCAQHWEKAEPAWLAVRYHETNVATFYRGGRIMLDSGGWQSASTRDVMRACGIRNNSDGGIVSVEHGGRSWVFNDKMVLRPDGTVKCLDAIDPFEARQMRMGMLRKDPSYPRCQGRKSTYWPGIGNAPYRPEDAGRHPEHRDFGGGYSGFGRR